MGHYIYLWCAIHHEYVHVGKAGRINFEGPENVFAFIQFHNEPTCHIITVHELDETVFSLCMNDREWTKETTAGWIKKYYSVPGEDRSRKEVAKAFLERYNG